ncbi:hypothetical protein BJ138DRAFT_1226039 [Hygrophoropsis aurantiaca]|uniref:Uncharacterized protein n=1 Tax=Hygrophoropsis aurantiaca TaxID=72124 RepID=A0ACB7ZXT8_9AGAM|nr:hypothetical protein BJ138DRAFT_1226039 [Hygrophoropsis aurantiaca]
MLVWLYFLNISGPLLWKSTSDCNRSLVHVHQLDIFNDFLIIRDLNIYLAVNWGQLVFILTMQAILAIRVYALFNRSKKVLIFLAVLYTLQATAVFVLTGLFWNMQALHEFFGPISPAIGSVTRMITTNASASAYLSISVNDTIVSVVFDTVLLFFALWAFVRHALGEKTIDGGWSINVLVRTLVADHLLYFVCNLTWLSITLYSNYIVELPTISGLLLDIMLCVFSPLVVIAGPRMVISIRAMENKTRGEGGTLEGEVSTIQFGVREPPTQPEIVIEEGSGL